MGTSGPVFRSLGPGDLNQLWMLLEEIYRSPVHPLGGAWSRALLERELTDGEGLALLAEGAIQAFILYRRVSKEVWEVSILGTATGGRRQGHMRELLSRLLDQRPKGVSLWLEVHESNHPALRLYQELGGRTSGSRPRYYRDGARAILISWPGREDV